MYTDYLCGGGLVLFIPPQPPQPPCPKVTGYSYVNCLQQMSVNATAHAIDDDLRALGPPKRGVLKKVCIKPWSSGEGS